MKRKLPILKSLKINGFTNIDIDQIVHYLDSLDYNLKKTKYIGEIISRNERLAKYFF